MMKIMKKYLQMLVSLSRIIQTLLCEKAKFCQNNKDHLNTIYPLYQKEILKITILKFFFRKM